MQRPWLLAALASSACGAPQPAPVVLARAPAAPSALPARWILEEPLPPPEGEVALPAGARLSWAGARRWSVDAAGAVRAADALASPPIASIRADGSGLLVLHEDGGTSRAAEPLGPLVRTAASRAGLPAGARFVFGRAARVGVTADGRVFRALASSDAWTPGPLVARRGEAVRSVAADLRGGVVAVLLQPQRLLASTDDGATFARVPLLGQGARRLAQRSDGALWLELASGAARLTPELRLEVQAPARPAPDPPGAPVRWLAAGDRRVRAVEPVVGRRGSFALGPWLGPLGPPRALDEGERVVAAAGWAERVVVAVAGACRPRHSCAGEILETTDDGRSFTSIGRFRPHEEPHLDDRLLAVGPDGWALASVGCLVLQTAPDPAGRSERCGPHARVAGTWVHLDGLSPGAVAVAADRAVIWDARGHLVELPFGARAVTELRPLGRTLALGVDAEGVVAVQEDALVRLQPGASAVVEPLPEPMHAAALAGARGLLVARSGRGWETSDAGKTWVETAAVGELSGCSPGGCAFGGNLRVGWDLPARDRERRPAVAAPPEPAPQRTHVRLTCALAGARWTPVLEPGGLFDGYDLALDARWQAHVWDLDGRDPVRLLSAHGGAGPRLLELGRPAKGERVYQQGSPEGLFVGRFSFGPRAPDGGYGPVDVRVDWLDAATGKPGRARARLEPFRVGRQRLGASFWYSDGSAWLWPHGGRRIHHLRASGAVSLPAPPGAWGSAEIVRAGGVLVVGESTGDEVSLALTTDDGVTWRTARWTLGSSASLTVVGRLPALQLLGAEGVPISIPLRALGPDLPAWHAPEPLRSLAPCDPKRNPGAMRRDEGLSVELRVDLRGGQPLRLTSEDVVTRVDEDGRRCVGAVHASSEDHDHWAIVSPHDLAHGLLFRRTEQGRAWATLSCAPR